ncbi:MAG: tyrosine-type recombinase/integrase [Solirubrobacteraceae bacterium]
MPSRKAVTVSAWAASYEQLALSGVRSREVTERIALHLRRFSEYLTVTYGHERVASVVRRDVVGWRDTLVSAGLGPSTVNNHLASLSGFCGWVAVRAPDALPGGDPTTGVRTLALAPLEPRALSPAQVRSLKSVVDRLERFHARKGRRGAQRGDARHRHSRPLRDRAIVHVLLSTGLRREELVTLDLAQVSPRDPGLLREAKRARLVGVVGKDGTTRTVFLSADARTAVAEYVELERPGDADGPAAGLFLSAVSIASRRPGGRLSPRAVNSILERIGRWHDAEHSDPARWVSPLRPHDLRHTCAFALAETTGKDAYELERRLGHRSQRYITRYTNPPEDIAAAYIEGM